MSNCKTLYRSWKKHLVIIDIPNHTQTSFKLVEMSFTKYFLLLFFCFCMAFAFAQDVKEGEQLAFKPEKTRILFLLDASGSMKQQWNGKTKFELSKEIIGNLVDSLSATYSDLEVGVRIFGHQFPRSAHNCLDSKLEIPIGKHSGSEITQSLDKINPQGYTPITYSLEQAVNDFKTDQTVINVVILVTDGEENCDGNPCSAAKALSEKRISLKPYIIGLNLNVKDKLNLDCAGTFFDAQNDTSFARVMKTVVNQALTPTSLQINLLDINGKPTVTNIPITLYDEYGGKILYNFIHTLNDKGQSDTLWINPAGTYIVQVHSIPPVVKQDVELTPGKHNLLNIPMPIGYLTVTSPSEKYMKSVQGVVREAYGNQITYVQDLNSTEPYIRGDFDIELLTTPRYSKKLVYIPEEIEKQIIVPNAGKVSLVSNQKCRASIYEVKYGKMNWVKSFETLSGKVQEDLLPGDYALVFIPNGAKKSDFSKTIYFHIESNQVSTVNVR